MGARSGLGHPRRESAVLRSTSTDKNRSPNELKSQMQKIIDSALILVRTVLRLSSANVVQEGRWAIGARAFQIPGWFGLPRLQPVAGIETSRILFDCQYARDYFGFATQVRELLGLAFC